MMQERCCPNCGAVVVGSIRRKYCSHKCQYTDANAKRRRPIYEIQFSSAANTFVERFAEHNGYTFEQAAKLLGVKRG